MFDLTKAKNKKHLLEFIGIDEKTFASVLFFTEKNKQNVQSILDHYETDSLPYNIFQKHKIPKKSKNKILQYRTVWEASRETARVFKTLNRRLSSFIEARLQNFPHQSSYGFVKGKNILENAIQHTGKKYILHVDIENFFPSISIKMIHEAFVKLGVTHEVSGLLSQFVTIHDMLPQGIHTSPTISNLAFYETDNEIYSYSKRNNLTYTRYVDDITISSNSSPPKLEDINAILKNNSFNIAKEKCFTSKLGQAHFVTGLSVTDKKRPHIPRYTKRKLAQELYYCQKFGIRDHLDQAGPYQELQRDLNRLDGLIRYVSYIEKGKFTQLASLWNIMLEKEGLSPSYDKSLYIENPQDIFLHFDETTFCYNNAYYLVICMSSIRGKENRQKIIRTVNDTLDDYYASPFRGHEEIEKDLKNEKLHRCVADQDLRNSFQDSLKTLPYESYIILKKIPNENYCENDYLQLVLKIILDRLITYHGHNINFIFEKNSKIKLDSLKKYINLLSQDIRDHNKKSSKFKYDINMASKAEAPEISIPDFIAGIFKDYVEKKGVNKKNPEFKKLLSYREFEGIRDKIILIYDFNNNKVFTRKREFTHESWRP